MIGTQGPMDAKPKAGSANEKRSPLGLWPEPLGVLRRNWRVLLRKPRQSSRFVCDWDALIQRQLEAVNYTCRVNVKPGDRAARSVDRLGLSSLKGASSCAGHIKFGDGPSMRPHKAVIHIVHVQVKTGNRV